MRVAVFGRRQAGMCVSAWLLLASWASCSVGIVGTPSPGSTSKNAGGSYPGLKPGTTCGVVLFFHINKCAGGTVVKWLEARAARFSNEFSHSSTWVGSREMANQEWIEIEKNLTRFMHDTTGWNAAVLHHGYPGLAWMHNTSIPRWQRILERQGCGLALVTVLRDPIERTVSNIFFNNVEPDTVGDFILSRRNWLSRYLLYNICDRVGDDPRDLRCGYNKSDSFTMTPDLHDGRLYKWLDRFAVIGFSDRLESFLSDVTALTGWKSSDLDKQPNKVHQSAVSAAGGRTAPFFSEAHLRTMVAVNKADFELYHTYSVRDRARGNL